MHNEFTAVFERDGRGVPPDAREGGSHSLWTNPGERRGRSCPSTHRNPQCPGEQDLSELEHPRTGIQLMSLSNVRDEPRRVSVGFVPSAPSRGEAPLNAMTAIGRRQGIPERRRRIQGDDLRRDLLNAWRPRQSRA